jgi:hypothetical protein
MNKWVYEPTCLCRSEGYSCARGENCAEADLRRQREEADAEFEALGHWFVPKICIAVGLVALCFLIAERLAQ